ncbi:MAG TPA: methylated-DNA--[protein]-cysteine S-methyltransferase [Anaerolineales bacterium]
MNAVFAIDGITTSQLGEVWAAASPRGLVAVEFGVSREAFEATIRQHGARRAPELRSAGHGTAEAAACQIAEYLAGRRRFFEVPIDWSVLASDFQRAALKAVAAIPYGQTRTYGQIAAQIGHSRAPRAVGRANATNPMPLVIPCHRVIGTDGTLHGYGGRGGLKTKRWLLELEAAALPLSPKE